jgi:hypothetical protein
MTLKLDLPHAYELEPIEELPGSGQLRQSYFGGSFLKPPPGEGIQRREGLLLRVISPGKKPWIAIVKGSFDVPGSGIYSTFDPEKFCIVAGGYGCFVSAASPEQRDEVRAIPVTDVKIIQDRSMFIFSDFIKLCAYTCAGLIWESPRVCWDDLKIVSINEKTIDGTGYDPTTTDTDKLMQFSVDLETGESLLPRHPTWDNW